MFHLIQRIFTTGKSSLLYLRACISLSMMTCFFSVPSSYAIEISDVPLEVSYKSAAPVVMIVLDDSGSMDWEIMTSETRGAFDTPNELIIDRYYIFPDLGDNLYRDSMVMVYSLIDSERRYWKTQWAGYNAMFYNPSNTYTPWVRSDGTGDMDQASTTIPRSNPMNESYTLNLQGEFTTIGGITIPNAHYYIVNDLDGDKEVDSDEDIYLVCISNSSSRSFYQVNDINGDSIVNDNELVSKIYNDLPESIRPPASIENDLQNFANWYTYYRKRILSSIAATSRTISEISGIRVGVYGINESIIQPPLIIKSYDESGNYTDNSELLLDKLYSLELDNNATPLREGLKKVGQYFSGESIDGLTGSPFENALNGGECQRTYALLLTDGYWTDNSFFSLSPSDPDGDRNDETLADVAMKYYMTDINSDLANLLKPNGCDEATHQHVTTFGVSFGVTATLNPDGYDPCTLEDEDGSTPSWPDPDCGECHEKIDDLWHAAANSKGEFFSASNPEELIASIKKIFQSIVDMEDTGASVTVNSHRFYVHNTLYQGSFRSNSWTGDLSAYQISYEDSGSVPVIETAPLWRASENLRWNQRSIITFNGESGIPFEWSDNLTDDQKAFLDNDETYISYLRGQNVNGFRERVSLLGDIVHSGALLEEGILYVGANDGMLHAFDADNGDEKFAYIPNLVFSQLKDLAEEPYEHRYFVDQTPVCADITVNGEKKAYLVGGLGKGGKGYYCLDITDMGNRTDFSESALSSIIKWELSDSENLGYTFSSPVIVRTYSETYPYVILFGNGYNSQSGKAQLFVVDPASGNVIRRIDTGIGTDNGLSTPIATDVNNDSRADFVYAGDLRGNLWKWDISSENIEGWCSYYVDNKGDSAPLFTTPSNQPITTRPDVMRHCCRSGYIVCFGTGKLLGSSDLLNLSTQTIYGIWDYGEDPEDVLGTFDPATRSLSLQPQGVTLLEQTILSTGTESTEDGLYYYIRTISENIPTWANFHQNFDNGEQPEGHAGWFLNLPANERVYQDVSISNNVLTALAAFPSDAPCSGGGYTMIYFLNPCTGAMVQEARTSAEPETLNPPITISTPDDDLLIFEKGKQPADKPDDGVRKGLYFWREFNKKLIEN